MKNAKKLLLIILLNLIVISSYVFSFSQITKQYKEISSLTALVESLRGKVSTETQKKIKEISEKLNEVSSYYVQPDGSVSFIEMIDDLGRKNNLDITINSVDIDSTGADKTVELLKLKISTEGSWNNSFKFLTSLENLPFKISVDESSLKKNQGEKGDIWSGSFSFTALKIAK